MSVQLFMWYHNSDFASHSPNPQDLWDYPIAQIGDALSVITLIYEVGRPTKWSDGFCHLRRERHLYKVREFEIDHRDEPVDLPLFLTKPLMRQGVRFLFNIR